MSLLLDAIKKASKDRVAQKKANAEAEKSDDTALTDLSGESLEGDEDKTVFKIPDDSGDDTALNAVPESDVSEVSADEKNQSLDLDEDGMTLLDYTEVENVSVSSAGPDGRSGGIDDTTFIEYDEKNEVVEDVELRLADDGDSLGQKKPSLQASKPQGGAKSTADLIGQMSQLRSAGKASSNDEAIGHAPKDQTDTKTSLTDRLGRMGDLDAPAELKEDKEATSYSHAKTITGFTSKAAKNVFDSKSKSEKLYGRNAKIYVSLGLVVAIAAFIFIYYAEKVDDIDSELVRYQRDPAVKNLSLAERNRLNAERANKNTSKLAPRKDKQKKYGTSRVANSGDVGIDQKRSGKSPQADTFGKETAILIKKLKQPIKISSSVSKPKKSVKLNDAYALYIAGDYEAAKTAYESLLADGQETQGAMHGLAAINLRQGDIGAAKTAYLKLLEIDPKDVVAGAGLLSVSELKSSTSRETALKLMLAEKPGSAYLHAELGNAYSASQRWPAAQSSYFEAVKLQPNNAAYAINLAVSLDQLGKTDEAIRYYQRGIGLSDGIDVSFDVQAINARVNALQGSLEGSSNK